MTRLYRLAVVTAVATYALIVLGGITRVSDSGMGCADHWPKCHGKWYPPFELQPIIEYLHRTVAATIGALILATAIGTLLVRGTSRRTRLAAWSGFVLVIVQGLLGAVTVWWELPADIVTAHLGTAMIFFAVTLLTAYLVALDRGAPGWLVGAGRDLGLGPDRRFIRAAQVGVAVIFVLMLSGAYTSTSGAALACTDWPLCYGMELIPERTSSYTWIHLGHRAAALIGTIAVAAVAVAAWRRPTPRAARRLAMLAVGIVGVQVLLGAAYVLSKGSPWLSGAHLATATLLWATMLAVVVVARRPEGVEARGGLGASPRRPVGSGGATAGPASAPAPMRMSAGAADEPPGPAALRLQTTGPAASAALTGAYAPGGPALRLGSSDVRRTAERARAVVADYVALTKPGILTLLLLTTLGAMLIAAEAVPPFGLVLATLVGGALAAGGANVLNCYLDRDIDARMPRTRGRATVVGRVSPRAALLTGLALTTVATLELGFLVNWLAAGLALAGNAYYVLVYTKWLKRVTPHNIVIGGAAGAVPPLVGWAAATGELSAAAWVLFGVIFAWTPPHFWALALLKQGEYGRAGVPMLPVVAGEAETRRQIVAYSVVLVAACLLLVPLGLGPLYLAAAVALNAVFLGMAVRLRFAPSKRLARHLFLFSLWYLALLFAAAVADRLVLA